MARTSGDAASYAIRPKVAISRLLSAGVVVAMLLLGGTRTQRCCDRSLTLPVPGQSRPIIRHSVVYLLATDNGPPPEAGASKGRVVSGASTPSPAASAVDHRPPCTPPTARPCLQRAGCPCRACPGFAWADTRIRDGLARLVASRICGADHAAAPQRVSLLQRPPLDSQHRRRRSRLSGPCPSAAAAVPRVAPA